MQVSGSTPATSTSPNFQASGVRQKASSAGDPDGDGDIEAAEQSAQQAKETGTGITFSQLA